MSFEIWKDVVGYEGLYIVSTMGNVKSIKSGNILKQSYNGVGYLVVGLKGTDNKIRTCNIHRLVAETFILNRDKKRCVNHINGIKSDNQVENLEWATHKENSVHYHKNKNNEDWVESDLIYITIDKGTKTKLMKAAKKDKRSLSNFIRLKLSQIINN